MPGYHIQTSPLDSGSGHKLEILSGNEAISYRDVLQALVSDRGLDAALTQAIADCTYEAVRFETPAVTVGSLDAPFEFVLIDSPGLIGKPDPSSFAEQLETAESDQSVIAFPNLRGDSTMIVPRPIHADSPYTHLLDFLRHAPTEQIKALWAQVGQSMLEEINEQPLWLSTAGGGVPWLHVRIDPRPKYYSYGPYTGSS